MAFKINRNSAAALVRAERAIQDLTADLNKIQDRRVPQYLRTDLLAAISAFNEAVSRTWNETES